MSEHRPTRPLPIGIAIVLACVAVDQATKLWALRALHPGEYHPLVGKYFGLQLVHNPGAAFSIGDTHTWVFTVIAAVVVVAAAWMLPTITRRSWLITVAVFLGGAIGNLIDRLFQPPAFARGHVVDFLAYSNWFVGNIADIFLVAAAIMMAILALFSVPSRAEHDQSDADETKEASR